MRPRISGDDKVKAISRLDSIADVVRSGKATFEQAVSYFSEDKNTALNAGLMMNEQTGASKFEYQDLPPEVAKQIYSMNIGEISKPFVMMDPQKNREVVAIVKLKTKVAAHKANLTDDYQVVRQLLVQKQSEELLKAWVQKKQQEIYVHIDENWRGCDFQFPGWVK